MIDSKSTPQEPRTEPYFSEFVQGFWRMDAWAQTPQQNLAFIEQCLELGVSSFDQTNIYGWQPSCEEIFGEALALNPRLRDQMQIISKCNIRAHGLPEGQVAHYETTYDSITQSAELSLKRMGIEHLDALLIHRLDYLMHADEVARAFADLKTAGKVSHFGVSNFTPSQFSLLQSRLNTPLITNQVEINPLRFEVMEDGTLDQLQQLRVRPMAWSPFAGGEIFSATPSSQVSRVQKTLRELSQELDVKPDQIILAWIRQHPSQPRIILGTKQIQRVQEALEATELTLSNEQWYRLWVASKGHGVP